MMTKKKLNSIVDFDFNNNEVVYEDEATQPLEEHPVYAEDAKKVPMSTADEMPEEKTKLWEKRTWAGVKEVFMCTICGEFRDSKDDIITHIVDHYPVEEQSNILDQLVVLARPRGELAGLSLE